MVSIMSTCRWEGQPLLLFPHMTRISLEEMATQLSLLAESASVCYDPLHEGTNQGFVLVGASSRAMLDLKRSRYSSESLYWKQKLSTILELTTKESYERWAKPKYKYP